jgi:hypothetical protein
MVSSIARWHIAGKSRHPARGGRPFLMPDAIDGFVHVTSSRRKFPKFFMNLIDLKI